VTNHKQAPPELQQLIARCEERHPGDQEKQVEWLLQIVRYCITRKLFDASTLDTLRKDAEKWPVSIQELLLAEGVAR
jgi:hypothetical protein